MKKKKVKWPKEVKWAQSPPPPVLNQAKKEDCVTFKFPEPQKLLDERVREQLRLVVDQVNVCVNDVARILLKDKKMRVKYQKAVEQVFDLAIQVVGARLVDANRIASQALTAAVGEMVGSDLTKKKGRKK